MTLHPTSIFGSAPWPMEFGNPFNTRVSPTRFNFKGEALWSIPIEEANLNRIVVAEDGCIFVTAGRIMMAIEPNGQKRWQHDAEMGIGSTVVLADGTLLHYEGRKLVSREQSTGKQLWMTKDGNFGRRPAIMPNGTIILIQQNWDHNNWSANTTYLCGLGPDKSITWKVPLTNQTRWKGFLVVGDMVIVDDASYFVAVNSQGQVLWLVNRQGFVAPDAVPPSQREQEYEEILTNPIYLSGTQFIAQCKWYGGRGIFVFDYEAKTVRMELGNIPTADVALSLAPTPRILGHRNGDHLNAHDLNGNHLFEVAFNVTIRSVMCDADGKFIVVKGYGLDEWEKYSIFSDTGRGMRQRNGVAAFDANGNKLAEWIAPSTIYKNVAAVGKNGEVYCASEGQLWAIG